MKKLFALLFVAIFMITLASAESFTFKQEEEVNFRFRCIDTAGEFCGSATVITLSLEAPNGSNVFDNSSMTSNPTFFNHTLSTADTGTYQTLIFVPGNENTTTEFTYQVTVTGEVLTTAGSTLFFGIFIIAIILFCICLLGFLRIPYENPRSDDRLIIGIQHLKYVKILMGYFAYLMLIFISFLLWTTAKSYLFLNVAELWFKLIFYGLIGTLFPLTVAFVIFGFTRFALDKNIQKGLRRGISVR